VRESISHSFLTRSVSLKQDAFHAPKKLTKNSKPNESPIYFDEQPESGRQLLPYLALSWGHMRMRYFSVGLGYALFFVAVLMALVMPTAADRASYIRHFENPLATSRLEIGFQYYIAIFNFLNVEAQVAIILTCCLIYFLFARAWLLLVKTPWIESLLLFNFFSFSLMNYYLGTSIRMGLAMGAAVLISAHVLRGHRFLIFLLPLTALLHYGTLYFVGAFSFFFMLRTLSFKYHVFLIGAASFMFVSAYGILVGALPLGDYYLQYFTGDLGRTERLFPLTVLFYLIVLLLVAPKLFRIGRLNTLERNMLYIIFYGLPLCALFLTTFNPIFGKLLMPIVFLSAATSVIFWGDQVSKLFRPELRLVVLLSLNLISLAYALKMYNFF